MQTTAQPAAAPTPSQTLVAAAQRATQASKPAPPTSTAPRPQAAAGGSILSRLQRITTKEAQQAAAPAETKEKAVEAKAIDPNALIAAWKEFANSLPVSENYLKTIMATTPACSGNEITLNIITPSQAMIAEHQGLITYLRERLSNPTIIIKTRLVETEAQATATTYTSKQKLDVMINENKSLKNMIEKFGLSFDY